MVEAANYGYAIKNVPRGFVYHTPEEIADDDPQTPGYLAGTTVDASYTYFDSYLGFIFQLVPEHEGAYANYVNGKPYPSWANPNVNLNLQGISISFEGMAATIHKTMKRGGPQWTAGVDLVAHRAQARNISPDNWARHADVSIVRTDPGSLDLVAFTLDVKAKMEEDMAKFIQYKTAIAVLEGGVKWVVSPGSLLMKLYPEHRGNVIQLTEDEWNRIPNAHGPSSDGSITPRRFTGTIAGTIEAT